LVRDADWDIEEQNPDEVRPESGFNKGDFGRRAAEGDGGMRGDGGLRAAEGADAELRRQIEELAGENAMLRAEVHHLRRRDDTVNYTMTRIDEELRLAAKLQRDFMPKTLPRIGRAHFHSLFRPAGYVSGDLYEVQRLDEKHVGFFVADAVGHGMPAALLTMFMRQALQNKEVSNNSYRLLRPGETLARLNAVMVEQDLSQATFATAVCGVLNVETGVAMVASAGHPRPLVMPKGGEAYELMTDGALLGIFADSTFDDVTVTLRPGDRLVLYTDGVEVAFPQVSSDGDDQLRYENEKWREVLLGLREETAEGILMGLSSAIDSQVGSLSPGDDLTLILLEMSEEAA
jgi:sigma-B regulation protein RsbU (phosphoserine phosphatase)